MKTTNIYWIFTGLLGFLMLVSAIPDIINYPTADWMFRVLPLELAISSYVFYHKKKKSVGRYGLLKFIKCLSG